MGYHTKKFNLEFYYSALKNIINKVFLKNNNKRVTKQEKNPKLTRKNMANSSRFYLKTFPAYGWIKKNYAILCIF